MSERRVNDRAQGLSLLHEIVAASAVSNPLANATFYKVRSTMRDSGVQILGAPCASPSSVDEGVLAYVVGAL